MQLNKLHNKCSLKEEYINKQKLRGKKDGRVR